MKKFSNDVVEIRLASKFKTGFINRFETYYFDIYSKKYNVRVGYIDLRIGYSEYLYYLGNVGYRVYEEFRGNHYAYNACLLLFEYAKELQLPYLMITCSPENIASKKTLEKLNGIYMGQKNVPLTHPLYMQGEKIKCIYRYDIL